jgi:hypothetical protein
LFAPLPLGAQVPLFLVFALFVRPANARCDGPFVFYRDGGLRRGGSGRRFRLFGLCRFFGLRCGFRGFDRSAASFEKRVAGKREHDFP